MKTEKFKISQIKLNPDNPRIIKDDKFKQLVKSIQDFPEMLLLRPIVINKDNMILGGNMRLKACQEAGLKEIPVIRAENLTKAQQKEFIIKDNLPYGEWDFLKLNTDFDTAQLAEWGLEIPQLTTEGEEDNFNEPVPEKPKSKLGDLYELNEHRVYCADSTDAKAVEKLMNGKKADMVFTDPPYGINLETDLSAIKTELKGWHGQGGKYDKVIGDNEPFNFQDYLWLECKEQFWWGANYYAKTIPDGGSWFVWDKRQNENGNGVDGGVGSQFEICWSKEKHLQEIIRKLWSGLYGTETQDIRNRVHPTQKPIELCTWFISKFSEPEQKIIDFFLGSGSTLIACEQTDRICYGQELDKHYCDVIVRRWVKYMQDKNKPYKVLKNNKPCTDFETELK